MDSSPSSVVSISSMLSDVSDINEQTFMAPMSDTVSLIPEVNGKPLFEPGDGDMELIVNGTRFETHRYLIKRFNKWRDTASKQNSSRYLNITEATSCEDFSNMFKVLYATALEGPFDFDPPTLVSALRLATKYEYLVLRDYAIRHLEQAELSPISRVKIARELNLPSWLEPAYVDLCNRDETITEEEASILGMTTFVRVAKIREKEQRRRGRVVDAGCEENIELDDSDADKPKKETASGLKIGWDVPPETTLPPPPSGHTIYGRKRKAKKGATSTIGTIKKDGADNTVIQDQVKSQETQIQPSFVDVQVTGRYENDECVYRENSEVGLSVPGCSCSRRSVFGFGGITYAPAPCVLPACAAAAFKHLQLGQLAHAKDIVDIRSSIDKLQPVVSPKPTPDQEADVQSLVHQSIHEQVREMLSELS
ncbi:hypothetical protein RHS04_05242 [Rhizoctonia solani]|uniref:BTB domain-containing protein n=1 Tax=Rhizoctonia solani TaxID=456999 RepID=A0A8H7LH33_9AGAM|nr:hypothetical protein RHS04_05242 [Rhizoctonia solani]